MPPTSPERIGGPRGRSRQTIARDQYSNDQPNAKYENAHQNENCHFRSHRPRRCFCESCRWTSTHRYPENVPGFRNITIRRQHRDLGCLPERRAGSPWEAIRGLGKYSSQGQNTLRAARGIFAQLCRMAHVPGDGEGLQKDTATTTRRTSLPCAPGSRPFRHSQRGFWQKIMRQIRTYGRSNGR